MVAGEFFFKLDFQIQEVKFVWKPPENLMVPVLLSFYVITSILCSPKSKVKFYTISSDFFRSSSLGNFNVKPQIIFSKPSHVRDTFFQCVFLQCLVREAQSVHLIFRLIHSSIYYCTSSENHDSIWGFRLFWGIVIKKLDQNLRNCFLQETWNQRVLRTDFLVKIRVRTQQAKNS